MRIKHFLGRRVYIFSDLRDKAVFSRKKDDLICDTLCVYSDTNIVTIIRLPMSNMLYPLNKIIKI